jgi:HEAT repeat protein
VIIIIFLLSLSVQSPPLPKIEGRPLTSWLAEVGFDNTFQRRPANDVLYAAGPAIIPALVKMLQQNTPPLERLPSQWLPQFLLVRRDTRMKNQVAAAYMIGAIAYRNRNCLEAATAVPALIKGLSHADNSVRMFSIEALAAIGSHASNAIPALVPFVTTGSTNSATNWSSSLRLCAVESLGHIGVRSPETLRAVQASLTDANYEVRWIGTQALARLGMPSSSGKK